MKTILSTVCICFLVFPVVLCGAEPKNFILLSSTIGPIDAGIVPALEEAFEKEV